MCVDDAVKLGLIQNNVVRLTKAPKLSKKEIVILSKDEVSRIIGEAKKINNAFKIMMPEIISLTVHTGLSQYISRLETYSRNTFTSTRSKSQNCTGTARAQFNKSYNGHLQSRPARYAETSS